MSGSNAPVPAQVPAYQARIERVLAEILPSELDPPHRLHAAQRYSVLGGGKRLRPLLVYATGAALAVPAELLDAPAAAVELIHAYSLVHDDLPAMDDDDLRRGRPTTHRAYDEATAILVGDALQVLAFSLLAGEKARAAGAPACLKMVQILAEASGTAGMAGGQALDLAAVGQSLTLNQLETMHRLKTGALIRASVLMAAACVPELPSSLWQDLEGFSADVGLAFQIQDDILDVEGAVEDIGKQTGADAARSKPTYTSLMGLEPAKVHAQTLKKRSLQRLEGLKGDTTVLSWLACYAVDRRV